MAILSHSLMVHLLGEFGIDAGDVNVGDPAGTEELRTELTDQILESRYGITVDWRGELSELLDPLADGIAEECGVSIDPDFVDEDSAEVAVTVNGNTKRIKLQYRPNEDDLRDSVKALQQASDGRFEFYELRETADSDTYCWAVLPAERWTRLRNLLGGVFREVFVDE